LFANNYDRSLDKLSNLKIDNKSNHLGNTGIIENLEYLNINAKKNFDDQTDIVIKHNNIRKNNTGDKGDNKFSSKIENATRMKIFIIKIEIPPETLDAFENPVICRICFSEKMTGSNKAEFTCGHNFCCKCVTNHLTFPIKDGKVIVFFLNLYQLVNKKIDYFILFLFLIFN